MKYYETDIYKINPGGWKKEGNKYVYDIYIDFGYIIKGHMLTVSLSGKNEDTKPTINEIKAYEMTDPGHKCKVNRLGVDLRLSSIYKPSHGFYIQMRDLDKIVEGYKDY